MSTFVVNESGLTVIPPVPAHASIQSFRGDGEDNSFWNMAFGDGNVCTSNIIAYMGGALDANGLPTQTKSGSNVYFSMMGADQNSNDVFFGSLGAEVTQNATSGAHGAKVYLNYVRQGESTLTRFLCMEEGRLHLKIDELHVHRPGGVGSGVTGDVTLEDGTLLRFWCGILVLVQPAAP